VSWVEAPSTKVGFMKIMLCCKENKEMHVV